MSRHDLAHGLRQYQQLQTQGAVHTFMMALSSVDALSLDPVAMLTSPDKSIHSPACGSDIYHICCLLSQLPLPLAVKIHAPTSDPHSP